MAAPASVFQLAQHPKPSIRKKAAIDPELLAVEHNFAMPAGRATPEGKYLAKFKLLKPNSAIVCEVEEAGVVRAAMAKMMKNGRLPNIKGCLIRTVTDNKDGRARVVAVKVESTATKAA